MKANWIPATKFSLMEYTAFCLPAKDHSAFTRYYRLGGSTTNLHKVCCADVEFQFVWKLCRAVPVDVLINNSWISVTKVQLVQGAS